MQSAVKRIEHPPLGAVQRPEIVPACGPAAAKLRVTDWSFTWRVHVPTGSGPVGTTAAGAASRWATGVTAAVFTGVSPQTAAWKNACPSDGKT